MLVVGTESPSTNVWVAWWTSCIYQGVLIFHGRLIDILPSFRLGYLADTFLEMNHMNLSLQGIWQQLLSMIKFVLSSKNENFEKPLSVTVNLLAYWYFFFFFVKLFWCDFVIFWCNEVHRSLEDEITKWASIFQYYSWEVTVPWRLTRMAGMFMPSFREHHEVGWIFSIWHLLAGWSHLKPQNTQMFWAQWTEKTVILLFSFVRLF